MGGGSAGRSADATQTMWVAGVKERFDASWGEVRGKLDLALRIPGLRKRLGSFLDMLNEASDDHALAEVTRHILKRIAELREK